MIEGIPEQQIENNEARTNSMIRIGKTEVDENTLREAIPAYDELDYKSRMFVLTVWNMSTQSRDQFLQENPKIQSVIEQCTNYNNVEKKYEDKRFKKELTLKEEVNEFWQDLTTKTKMSPHFFEDSKGAYLSDMFELVRLHILELIDSEKSDLRNVSPSYSKALTHQTEKIIKRLQSQLQEGKWVYFPESGWHLLQEIKDNDIPSDTIGRLKIIHDLISATHQFYKEKGSIVPDGKVLIKDLWRYCAFRAVESEDFSTWSPREAGHWNRAALEFYNSLNSISFKE